MRIDGYQVCNGHVIAVFITDKKRNMKQHKYEPARPHGEWIHTYESIDGWGADRYKCSKCGEEISTYGKPYNFCRRCGADMSGGGEEKWVSI